MNGSLVLLMNVTFHLWSSPSSGTTSRGRGKSSGGSLKEKVLESLACMERFYGIKQLADNRQSMAPIEFR
jgi:hypothetical protein